MSAHLSLTEADDELAAKFTLIRADLRDEYFADEPFPWIVGFSGGKDSTLVAHLVFEMLLNMPPSRRHRAVHIVSNDTLVESPLVIGHIRTVQAQMQEAAEAFNLPVKVVTTQPTGDDTFWVNLIGRGYPSPNRSFRWCTDRMKIKPTSRYIREQVDITGRAILLLGVRRDESAKRAESVAKYDNGQRLNRHNDMVGCMVFRPIVDLTTEEVWEFLASTPSPWGASHGDLITLYRNSLGGECPVIVQKSDAPSCGTSSSRFGCWTCTVVQKDRSLEGFVDAGFVEFGPLLEFRDWLAKIRNDPSMRSARRRNGKFTVTDSGLFVPGPFTPDARAEILKRLLSLQREVGRELISKDELAHIRVVWRDDAMASSGRYSSGTDNIIEDQAT